MRWPRVDWPWKDGAGRVGAKDRWAGLKTQAQRAFLEHLAPRLVRSGLLYDVGERLARLRAADYPPRATGVMAQAGLSLVRRAYSRRYRRRVVWTNVFAPTEILYAMDLLPFSLEAAAATAASLGLAGYLLDVAERNWYSSDSCSFHRCALGAALAGFLPAPAALLCTSHICDGAPKAFARCAEAAGRPLFVLDTPVVTGGGAAAAAESYLARQIETAANEISRLTGSALRPERLREACRLSNEARRWMLECAALRRDRPAPVTGAQSLGFLFAVFTMQGSQAAVDVYRTLARELAARRRDGRAAVPRETARLLWLHLYPFYPNGVLTFLEQGHGAVVVAEEFTHVYWDDLDPHDPFASLARKCLSHFGYGEASRRARAVAALAQEYDVDGVIHFSHWGCRQSCGGVRLIKDELGRRGVPLLALDGDCVDRRSYAEGQTLTRLAAFLEMLGVPAGHGGGPITARG